MHERRFNYEERRQRYDLDYFAHGGIERRKRLYEGRREGETIVKKYVPPPKGMDKYW